MKRCKTQSVRVCLLLLTAVWFALPARAQDYQRGYLGLDAGETSDKFGGVAPVWGFEGGVDGEFALFKSTEKKGSPYLAIGGEIRFPADTQKHSSEFAGYAGPQFAAGTHWDIGFHVQVRKLFVPPGQLGGVAFSRDKMLMLELPFVVEYKFGPALHAFVQLQVSPEFSPRLRATTDQPPVLPNPSFDYGYSGRATVGYSLGKWYVKGTYQSRYLKFKQDLGNPNELYNWRATQITGGVGVTF
jgi:hypothetical protein